MRKLLTSILFISALHNVAQACHDTLADIKKADIQNIDIRKVPLFFDGKTPDCSARKVALLHILNFVDSKDQKSPEEMLKIFKKNRVILISAFEFIKGQGFFTRSAADIILRFLEVASEKELSDSPANKKFLNRYKVDRALLEKLGYVRLRSLAAKTYYLLFYDISSTIEDQIASFDYLSSPATRSALNKFITSDEIIKMKSYSDERVNAKKYMILTGQVMLNPYRKIQGYGFEEGLTDRQQKRAKILSKIYIPMFFKALIQALSQPKLMKPDIAPLRIEMLAAIDNLSNSLVSIKASTDPHDQAFLRKVMALAQEWQQKDEDYGDYFNGHSIYGEVLPSKKP